MKFDDALIEVLWKIYRFFFLERKKENIVIAHTFFIDSRPDVNENE